MIKAPFVSQSTQFVAWSILYMMSVNSIVFWVQFRYIKIYRTLHKSTNSHCRPHITRSKVMDLEWTLYLAQKTYSFNNSLKNQYFRSILFGIGMPQTLSTCPYRFPLAKMCLVYPQKCERDIVPWFVTPCGIWPQHDQIDPFSNYKKGKSE